MVTKAFCVVSVVILTYVLTICMLAVMSELDVAESTENPQPLQVYGPYTTLRIGTITKHPHGTIYTKADVLFEMADGYYVSAHGDVRSDGKGESVDIHGVSNLTMGGG